MKWSRELVGGWVQCGDAPSGVVFVARRGVVVLHDAFGVLRHEDTMPTLRRDAIFRIALRSKPITAGGNVLRRGTIAPGIMVVKPFSDYLIPRALGATKSWAVGVPDAESLETMRGVNRHEGLFLLTEGATTIGASAG